MSWFALAVDFFKGLFGVWLGHKTDVAKEAGKDEQRVTDLTAQLEAARADSAAAAAVDQRIVREGPGANDVVAADSPAVADSPDFPRD